MSADMARRVTVLSRDMIDSVLLLPCAGCGEASTHLVIVHSATLPGEYQVIMACDRHTAEFGYQAEGGP